MIFLFGSLHLKHSQLVPGGGLLSNSQNSTCNRLMEDSRGSVALLRQHPQQERSLLIGLVCWGDDDVATRGEGASKDHLPAAGVAGAVEDRALGTQVLRRQIRVLRVSLQRQHTLIIQGYTKYNVITLVPYWKLVSTERRLEPWTFTLTEPSCSLFSAEVEEVFRYQV